MGKNELNIIKDSIIDDYYTAAIKSEVALDALITPVIDEILNLLIERKDGVIKYITKEFPILKCHIDDAETEITDYSSINVDYVLADNNIVYFVELKTTMSSIDEKQEDNYKNINDDEIKKYAIDFIKLLNHNSSSGIGDKRFPGEMNEKSYGIEMLKELFDRIVGEGEGKTYSERAKVYLKEQGKSLKGKKKYLFQAGQILDSGIDLWDGKKTIQVIYLAPDTSKKVDGIDRFDFSNIKGKSDYLIWLSENILNPLFIAE